MWEMFVRLNAHLHCQTQTHIYKDTLKTKKKLEVQSDYKLTYVFPKVGFKQDFNPSTLFNKMKLKQ